MGAVQRSSTSNTCAHLSSGHRAPSGSLRRSHGSRFKAITEVRKAVAACLAITAASLASFLIHKPLADFLPRWIGEHMEGVEIKRPPYGPEVVIPASLSAVEYGVALFAAYFLIRRAMPNSTVLVRSLCVFVLCLALGGQLLRLNGAVPKINPASKALQFGQ